MITTVSLPVSLLEELSRNPIGSTRNAGAVAAVGRYLADLKAGAPIHKRPSPEGPKERLSLYFPEQLSVDLGKHARVSRLKVSQVVVLALAHALELQGRFGPTLAPEHQSFSPDEVDKAHKILCDRYRAEEVTPRLLGWPDGPMRRAPVEDWLSR